jgi:hypothetical protein
VVVVVADVVEVVDEQASARQVSWRHLKHRLKLQRVLVINRIICHFKVESIIKDLVHNMVVYRFLHFSVLPPNKVVACLTSIHHHNCV